MKREKLVLSEAILAKERLSDYFKVEASTMPDFIDTVLIMLGDRCYEHGARSIERRQSKRMILNTKTLVHTKPEIEIDIDDDDTPPLGIRIKS